MATAVLIFDLQQRGLLKGILVALGSEFVQISYYQGWPIMGAYSVICETAFFVL